MGLDDSWGSADQYIISIALFSSIVGISHHYGHRPAFTQAGMANPNLMHAVNVVCRNHYHAWHVNRRVIHRGDASTPDGHIKPGHIAERIIKLVIMCAHLCRD